MNKNYIVIPLLLIISSCGGGGGSSQAPSVSIPPTPSSPSPSQPAEPSFSELKAEFENHYEYRRHWGLEAVNASSAYTKEVPLENNVLIGITDSGLDETHAEIKGANLSPNSDLEYSNYIPNTRQKRHGTMVASIAAGTLEKNISTPMHGVGFDSDILFVAIQLAEPDEDYDPVDLGDTDSDGNVTNADDVAQDFSGIDNFFSSLFDFYDFYNADIVNNSYGFSGNIIDYSRGPSKGMPSQIRFLQCLKKGLLNITKPYMYGLLEMLEGTMMQITQIQNCLLECLILLKKSKGTRLQL